MNENTLESADFRLLHLTPDMLKMLRPVTVLDVYENNSNNFHNDGLFSTTIFGRVGEPRRDTQFSYIDHKIEVLHPLIFRNVIKLKKFYGEIIKGNAYAIFDRKINDFVPSNPLDGETGYNFFLSKWEEIQFTRNDSKQRNARIDFIEKYRTIAKTSKILVLPAGLRDIEPGDDGRDKEGEINEFYRRILSISNALNASTDLNTRLTDSARLGIQNAFNNIYSYILNLSKGKGGFILRKWARRRVFNSTRTVLTAHVPKVENISTPNYQSWNQTAMGIAQLCKALLPVAIHKLITHPLVEESFPDKSTFAYLLDPKTLKRVEVKLPPRTADKWTTQSGLESLFQDFMEHSTRSSHIKIHDHYLGLIYRGPDKTFKILYDMDEVDSYDWMDKKYVHPITWVELFYLMGYKDWNKYPVMSTRYPISGAGSVFPSFVFVKTTASYETRWELDEYGNKIPDNQAIAFPILNDPVFIDGQSTHVSRIGGMGGDYDGDTVSGIVLYSQDSIEEVNNYLNSAKAFIRPGGGLVNSPYTDPINRVIINMTRG